MARFKTLRQKEKRYVFDFFGNRNDPNPAAVVFARFPQPDENFMPKAKSSVFEGINFSLVGKKDGKEIDRLIAAFTEHFTANLNSVDWEYFARECFERFEDFYCDGKEIKTVDDFLSLNPEMMTLIARDCPEYAKSRDEFTPGE